MIELNQIRYQIQGDALVSSFTNKKLVDPDSIEVMGSELLALATELKEHSLKRLVLDFDGVEFFSSSALSQFVLLHKKISELGAKLVTRRLTKELLEVFQITRLDQLFEVEENSDE